MDLSDLLPLGALDNEDRAKAMIPYIQEYLRAVQDRLDSRPKRMTSTRQKQCDIIGIGPDYYQHAVTAFVSVEETPVLEPVESEDITPLSHGIISTLLQQLHSRKTNQKRHGQLRDDNDNSVTQRSPIKKALGLDPSPANSMDIDMGIKLDAGLATASTSTQLDSKKSLPQGTPKRKRSLKQRQRRAERAKARRRRESKNKNWKQSHFKTRTDTQRRYAVRTVEISNAPNVDETELSKMTIPKPRTKNQPPMSTNDAVSDTNAKPATTESNSSSSKQQQKKKKKQKPRKPKSNVASLKAGFSRTFATSTQTIGSVQACLKRALLPASESGRIQRVTEDDINVIASRIGASVDAMAEARMYVTRSIEILILDELLRREGGGESGSREKAAATGYVEGGDAFDALDLLLGKATGTAIIKYLFSLVLNGKVDNRGPKLKSNRSKAAKTIALDAYARLQQILPGFRPVNKYSICLGRLVVDAAAELGDPFITFEERALPQILWSSSKKNPNPSAAAASKIMSIKDASTLVETIHGELTRILFYGNPQEIKHSRSVWQTSYGRRSTTMASLATCHPTVFDPIVLHAHVDAKFKHIKNIVSCKEQGIPCDSTPPSLPTTHLPQEPSLRPPRFALNNILATNGKELHVNCFDTMKSYRSKSAFAPIYRIETRFPTLQSILDEFSASSIEEIDVWGIDPGEVNTAAFCRILRTCSTPNDTNTAMHDNSGGRGQLDAPASSNRILPLGVEAKNLGILHGFFGSARVKAMDWDLKKAKKAEVDLAIDAILRECTAKTLFCYGNGSFRTGINLASPHESFKAVFAQKAVAAGHIVVLVDEYLTSSICPTCLESSELSRLAKPTIRSCVCLTCGRWLHRDIVGAHNIAAAGEVWGEVLLSTPSHAKSAAYENPASTTKVSAYLRAGGIFYRGPLSLSIPVGLKSSAHPSTPITQIETTNVIARLADLSISAA
ncbi:hypothetical protein BGW39_004788 [Mortierella sp. 14UC]|nr:hypothetical protein BGW39_004788 [Mortierella sp. 14UC]